MSTIRLTGALRADARTFTAPDKQTALLCVEVEQGPQSLPVIAYQRMGVGPAAQFAARKAAARLRRGTRVCVYAATIELEKRRRHLVLAGVDHIEQLDLPAAHAAQPEHEAA